MKFVNYSFYQMLLYSSTTIGNFKMFIICKIKIVQKYVKFSIGIQHNFFFDRGIVL